MRPLYIVQRFYASLKSASLKHDVWAISDQGIVSVSNFLTNVMLVRMLGLREFGVFTLAWISVQFLNSIQYSAIMAPVMSVAPKISVDDRPRYFGAVVLQQLIFAVACFLLLLFGTHAAAWILHAPFVVGLRWPLAWCVLFFQLQDFLRRYYFIVLRPGLSVLSDIISYLGQIGVLFVLLKMGKIGVSGALLVVAFSSLAATMVVLPFFERIAWDLPTFSRVTRRHWSSSKWLIGSSLMQWTSGNLFLLAAPAFYGPAAAGVLRIAQNLMGVTHTWILGLDNSTPVRAAHILHARGVRALRSYLLEIIAVWGGLTVCYASIVAIAPSLWMRLLYGNVSAEYGYVLRWYALLYIVMFAGLPLRVGLRALEFTRPIFFSYAAMTVFSVLFALPFAKYMGLSGTMLGMIGSQTIFLLIMAVSLFPRLSAAKPGVPSIQL